MMNLDVMNYLTKVTDKMIKNRELSFPHASSGNPEVGQGFNGFLLKLVPACFKQGKCRNDSLKQ